MWRGKKPSKRTKRQSSANAQNVIKFISCVCMGKNLLEISYAIFKLRHITNKTWEVWKNLEQTIQAKGEPILRIHIFHNSSNVFFSFHINQKIFSTICFPTLVDDRRTYWSRAVRVLLKFMFSQHSSCGSVCSLLPKRKTFFLFFKGYLGIRLNEILIFSFDVLCVIIKVRHTRERKFRYPHTNTSANHQQLLRFLANSQMRIFLALSSSHFHHNTSRIIIFSSFIYFCVSSSVSSMYDFLLCGGTFFSEAK